MRAFVYQKLLPTLHEKIHRIPRWRSSSTTPSCAHPRRARAQLREYLNNIEARQVGMLDFNQSLVDLVERG